MAERYRWTKADIALIAATLKTVAELQTAATRRAWIAGWWISFDGSTATNGPVLVELLRASAGITGTTLAANPVDAAGGAEGRKVQQNATSRGPTPTGLRNRR